LKRILVKYKLFICLIMLVNLSACGVKGNPVILSNVPDNAPIVKNMNAAAQGNNVILKWDFYDKDATINYIAIERSELGSAGNKCKDCPRTFERIGQVSVKEIKKENKGYNRLSFTDKKVTRTKIYNYRLLLCDDSNICLENAVTEINL
jgi:hypothetical protein